MLKKALRFAVAVAFAVAAMFLLFDIIPGAVTDAVYRTGYKEEVEKWCAEFSVDPALVYSVIKVESNFDPNAHSDVGAIGLMQMIEDSFDWTAWRLKREDLRIEDLYDPEYSIMFGTYLVGYLYDRYGSVELTAAAYHAGMTMVDSWIESGEVDPLNVTPEDIQGTNTRHYVRKILKAYEKYQNKLNG